MESTIFNTPGACGNFMIDSLQLEINEEAKYLDNLEQKLDLKIEYLTEQHIIKTLRTSYVLHT